MAFLEDEEKQILVERYFDIEWSDEVSDLRCVHCHRVAIHPYVSNCQHIFCKICSKFYRDELQLKCPQCQETITELVDNDFDLEVKLHQLKIYCPNKKHGCKHADQLRKIPTHLLTCTYTRVNALPGKSSAEFTSLNDAIGELRERTKEVNKKVEEKLNKLETKTDNIDRKFDQFEEKKDVKRKMKAMSMKITNLKKKVKGMELTSKKFTEQFQSMKSLLETIDQRVKKIESLHQQTTSNVNDMKIKMASMTQEIAAFQYKKSEESNIPKALTYEWIITDVKKNILESDKPYTSEIFEFIGYKYDIKAEMNKQDGAIAIYMYLQFNDGPKFNRLVKTGGFTKVKYIVRDQESNQERKDVILEAELSFYHRLTLPSRRFGQMVSNTILTPPYLKDDCMKITIVFDQPSIDRSFVSSNGIIRWTVDNYKKRKEEQLYAAIWSPSFYTSPQGYRVKTRLTIDDKQQMKVSIFFLTGEHDNALSFNFSHKTTVILFNQVDPSTTLTKTEQRLNVLSYTIELGSSKSIEESGFIKHDSLLLQVVIEPDSRKF